MQTVQEFPIYQNLCTQVYDIENPTPPDHELRFYRKYIEEAKGPILEPMCGSGRFLLPFLQEGFDLAGFDASPHMLKSLEQRGIHTAKVWQSRMEDLNEESKYNLAFIPSGSFNLITDMDAVVKSLQNIYRSLKAGGVFVVELITLEELKNTELHQWFGTLLLTQDQQKIIKSRLFLPAIKYVAPIIIKYELLEGSRVITTEIETYHHRFYPLNEFESLLKSIGFENIKAVKAFDHNHPPGYQDNLVIMECRKPI